MTTSRVDAENLSRAGAFLREREVELRCDPRLGKPPIEPDVIATTTAGQEVRIEVGEVVDSEVNKRDSFADDAAEAMTMSLRREANARGLTLPGMLASVAFKPKGGREAKIAVVAEVLRLVIGGARPSEWTDVRPLPEGVTSLAIKCQDVASTYFQVNSVNAFWPELRKLYEDKKSKPYALAGDTTLLCVIPAGRSGLGCGPWMRDAVELLREERKDSPKPFLEIVVFDEKTGRTFATIPARP